MKKMIGLLAFAFILNGCGNGDGDVSSGNGEDGAEYHFLGSSENWEVVYEVDISNGNEEESTGTIEYIGEGNAPETLEYYRIGSTEGTGRALNDGVADTGRTGCEGCAVTREDEEIEVEVTWNGQTENLTLTTED
nr:hypothetical protein FTX54_07565 [Alkalicoccus halolimnae]